EEPCLLKDIADAAAMGRHEATTFAIRPKLAVESDPAVVGTDQTCHQIYECGLAGPGRAEQRGEAVADGKADRQVERTLPVPDIDLQHHTAAPIRAAMRRDRTSEPTRAASDTAMEINVSLMAATSPPGT